jgi:hypothetical protein
MHDLVLLGYVVPGRASRPFFFKGLEHRSPRDTYFSATGGELGRPKMMRRTARSQLEERTSRPVSYHAPAEVFHFQYRQLSEFGGFHRCGSVAGNN